MSGSILKRISPSTGRVSWQAKIRIRGRWRTGTFKREKEARAALLQWQAEDEVAPHRPETLGDYLAHWLETVKRHQVRPSTYRSYRWQVRTQIVPALGRLVLADVTSTDIQRWESAEMDRPRQTDGGRRSARMVRYSHSLLAQALKHAHTAGLISKNPMEGSRRHGAMRVSIAPGNRGRWSASCLPQKARPTARSGS